MSTKRRQIHELSLLEVIQEVQNRIGTGLLPESQRQSVLSMIAPILQRCAQTNAPPLPMQNMQDIRGQEHVKRALEVAAAGGHNLLLVGPPGAGKRLLAQALPALLPATSIASPFRSPHVGTDRATFAGEMLLAHGGVLFLEEVAFLDLPQLAVLQEAVETHRVAASETLVFPAHFLLVATMRPCPCGFYGDPIKECSCSVEALLQYHRRIGSVIDACFDLSIEVPLIRQDITKTRPGESAASIRQRVEAARARQQGRYAEATHLWVNTDLQRIEDVQRYCEVDPTGERLLTAARQQLHLTPLQDLRTRRIARTSADLATAQTVLANHIAEAIQYRPRVGREQKGGKE